MTSNQNSQSCELKFNYDESTSNDFIIYMPYQLSQIFTIKGKVNDKRKFIESPQEMHKDGVVIGVFPQDLPETDDEIEFEVVLLPNKEIIPTIARADNRTFF